MTHETGRKTWMTWDEMVAAVEDWAEQLRVARDRLVVRQQMPMTDVALVSQLVASIEGLIARCDAWLARNHAIGRTHGHAESDRSRDARGGAGAAGDIGFDRAAAPPR